MGGAPGNDIELAKLNIANKLHDNDNFAGKARFVLKPSK
jgi:hypothetical protein